MLTSTLSLFGASPARIIRSSKRIAKASAQKNEAVISQPPRKTASASTVGHRSCRLSRAGKIRQPARGERIMATWTPDPSFYPSPRMAMKAAPETLAYVASFDPDRKTPDAIAVVDVDPKSEELFADRGHDDDAKGWRRGPSLRLERLLVLPVPERATCPCRAPVPGRARTKVLADLYPRHQARSKEP